MKSPANYRHLRKFLSHVINPSVVLWFWFIRWITHNSFLAWLQNDRIGKPSLLAWPFVCFRRCFRAGVQVWKCELSNYAIEKYSSLLKTHYSESGVGYFDYSEMSDADRAEVFASLTSRLTYYMVHNPTVLGYTDGDTFLDAGCGKGQNIKALVSCFPNSPVNGFDVNEGALRVITTATRDIPQVHVEQGSLLDFEYLEACAEGAFDHVIVSHVFSFLSGKNLAETKLLRKRLIDQLVRIADKTVIIMDSHILSDKEGIEVVIEQNTRCFFMESLASYFVDHLSRGELYALFSPEDKAFVFRRGTSA